MTRADPPASTPDPRSSLSLLTDRTFGPWFVGNLLSNSGNWLFNVTAAIVVFRLTGSALMVGMVSIAQFLPMVLASPFAGAVSDRVDRRRMLFWAQLGAAGCASTLAVSTLLLGMDGLPGAWPVLVTAGGIGLCQAITAPALNALVPSLVAQQDLEEGVALTSMTFNIGRAAGPAGAGVLLATLGAPMAFTINALSFLPLLVVLRFIRPRATRSTTDHDRSVRAGLRYVRRHSDVLLLLLGVAAAGFAADPTITLTPPLAAELGGGDSLVATMVSAFGIAGAATTFVVGRLLRAHGSLRIATTGVLVLAGSLLTAALAPVPAIAVTAFVGTGVGFVMTVTSFTTQLQRRLPDQLRGRVMALWGVAFLGNRPLAAAVDGTLADLIGPRLAMGLPILVALSSLLVVARLRLRTPGITGEAGDQPARR